MLPENNVTRKKGVSDVTSLLHGAGGHSIAQCTFCMHLLRAAKVDC